MQVLKLTYFLELALLLLLPLWPSQLALGLHTVCSWQPGKGSPETYHYSKLCDADLTNDTNAGADYKCVAGQVGNPGVVVASWGKRASEVLEWCEYRTGGAGGRCSADGHALFTVPRCSLPSRRLRPQVRRELLRATFRDLPW